jgi:hypothetical protein
MTMNAHIRRVALLACALFFAVSATGRAATERVFANFNFAVTPPNSWEDVTAQKKQPGLIVAYRDPANMRLVMVAQMDMSGPVPVIDDQFIAGFERGAEKSGAGKRLTGHVITVQGINAYERTGMLTVQGRSVYTLARTIPIVGHAVNLTALRAGGAAAEDPDIRHFLESFRFLTTPPHTSSAAYTAGAKMGYQIGLFLRRAPLPALVLIVLIAVVVVILVSR